MTASAADQKASHQLLTPHFCPSSPAPQLRSHLPPELQAQAERDAAAGPPVGSMPMQGGWHTCGTGLDGAACDAWCDRHMREQMSACPSPHPMCCPPTHR